MLMFDFAISVYTCTKTLCCVHTYTQYLVAKKKKKVKSPENVESGPSHVLLEQGYVISPATPANS